MIWLNPRTPVIVGIFLVTGLSWILATYSPMPGHLSATHGNIPELASAGGCDHCHSGEGIRQGCLSCHQEINQQIFKETGYHAHLLDRDDQSCGGCHPEHRGSDFPLISEVSWRAQTPAAFKHPHVQFELTDAHTHLPCEECHSVPLAPRFSLPGFPRSVRRGTFLGLTQDCQHCHDDQHSDGFTGDCGACHGQEKFHPPVHFDHGTHFPLEGGHTRLECSRCHILPGDDATPAPLPFPFEKVRGTECQSCHEVPHRARFEETCDACHSAVEPEWTGAHASMTLERHEETGFTLSKPHAELDCTSCHPSGLSFDQRHPDPSSPGYERHATTCQGCHEDVHGGQFRERGTCVNCHHQDFFRPTTFNQAAHDQVFALSDAHRAIACSDCHTAADPAEARAFVGTSRQCRDCHESPHADQFQELIQRDDCSTCHGENANSFALTSFDHDSRTGYPLEGAHALAACDDCHRDVTSVEGGGVHRRYEETPRDCASCHRDVHLGQFRKYDACESCHQSFTRWRDVVFDHNTQSRFVLDGSHSGLECSACHRGVELADGMIVVQYKPLGRECRNCHDVPRRRTDGGR